MTSKIIQYPPTQNPIVKTNSIEKQKNDKSSETLQKALTVAVPVVFGIGAALIYYYSKNSSAPIANMGSQENVKISTVTQFPILFRWVNWGRLQIQSKCLRRQSYPL